MSATAKHHNIKHKCYLAGNGNSMMVLIIDIINNDEDFDFKSISVIISPRKCTDVPLSIWFPCKIEHFLCVKYSNATGKKI